MKWQRLTRLIRNYDAELISIVFFNRFQHFLRKNIDIEKVDTKQLLNTVGW